MPTSSETAGKDDARRCGLGCVDVLKRMVRIWCSMEADVSSSDGGRWCFCLVVIARSLSLYDVLYTYTCEAAALTRAVGAGAGGRNEPKRVRERGSRTSNPPYHQSTWRESVCAAAVRSSSTYTASPWPQWQPTSAWRRACTLDCSGSSHAFRQLPSLAPRNPLPNLCKSLERHLPPTLTQPLPQQPRKRLLRRPTRVTATHSSPSRTPALETGTHLITLSADKPSSSSSPPSTMSYL